MAPTANLASDNLGASNFMDAANTMTNMAPTQVHPGTDDYLAAKTSILAPTQEHSGTDDYLATKISMAKTSNLAASAGMAPNLAPSLGASAFLAAFNIMASAILAKTSTFPDLGQVDVAGLLVKVCAFRGLDSLGELPDHLGPLQQAGQALGTGQGQRTASTDERRGQLEDNEQAILSWANWILKTIQRSDVIAKKQQEKRRKVKS